MQAHYAARMNYSVRNPDAQPHRLPICLALTTRSRADFQHIHAGDGGLRAQPSGHVRERQCGSRQLLERHYARATHLSLSDLYQRPVRFAGTLVSDDLLICALGLIVAAGLRTRIATARRSAY